MAFSEYINFKLLDSSSRSATTTTGGGEDCTLSYIGDGTCDDDCNFAQHSFDGGDCCGDDVDKDPDYCTLCECKTK